MESKIINTIEKFISFVLLNEPTHSIYSHLLTLEEDELIDFIIPYLNGDFLFKLNDSDGIKIDICFESWYYYSFRRNNNEHKLLSLYDLFEFNPDLHNIINKINDFQIQSGKHFKDYTNTWKVELLTDYLNMYLSNMKANELKEYIISIMDPIEPI
jgi:hypothetical protein